MTLGAEVRLRTILQRSRMESEMDAELRFHMEAYAEDLMRGGVPRSGSVAAARLEFGGVERTKEECREARGVHFAETLLQDLRYGMRTMLRTPGFTVTAVLALALGIGANTAIFSVVNAVLLRPLPFDQPERLLQVWHTPPQKSFPGLPTFTVSPANFLDWRKDNHSFVGMSAYGFGRYTLTGSGHPEAIRMVAATVGLFSILHAHPLVGRGFVDGEDEPGHEHEVVLSYGFWHSHFAGNPDIVGKNIQLNGQAFTVVGVMGPAFEFPISSDPDQRTQMWKPLAWSAQDRANRDNHNYAVIARLKDGVTLHQAQAELDAISNALAQAYPDRQQGLGSDRDSAAR